MGFRGVGSVWIWVKLEGCQRLPELEIEGM